MLETFFAVVRFEMGYREDSPFRGKKSLAQALPGAGAKRTAWRPAHKSQLDHDNVRPYSGSSDPQGAEVPRTLAYQVIYE